MAALMGGTQIAGALSHTPKGHGFDSLQGTHLGCGFVLVRVQMRGDQWLFLSFSFSLPPPLQKQINKVFSKNDGKG